jgi:hypothetical protein
MDDIVKTTQEPPSWIELETIKSLTVARQITSLSPDTLKRSYPEYCIRLSDRRYGMKFKHILGIAAGEIAPKSGVIKQKSKRAADVAAESSVDSEKSKPVAP